MSAVAAIAAVFAQPMIELLYGKAFAPTAPAFLWLLPGLVLLSANTILMNYFAAVGFPRAVMLVLPIALVINIAANIWLLPPLGIVGASAASTIAYGAMFVVAGAIFLRRYINGRDEPARAGGTT
jgi:O-antigen/teichoic acid export membrane protein